MLLICCKILITDFDNLIKCENMRISPEKGIEPEVSVGVNEPHCPITICMTHLKERCNSDYSSYQPTIGQFKLMPV